MPGDHRWQAEATAALAEWDEVWRAAGCPGPLGATKAANVRAEIVRLREANAAWMNGVADLVERFGFDRHAASGPADLLPGLELFKVVRDGCVYCAGTNEERPVLVCVRCGTGFYKGEQ